MKPLSLSITVLAVLFILSACSSTKETAAIIPPELLYQHPLPAFPKPIQNFQLRIPLEILVTENGTVSEVHFVNSSGNTVWDSAASASIKQWKYSPARLENKPLRIWLRQTAIVRFSEPNYLLLEEIVCNSSQDADSAYALLLRGMAFEEVVSQYSIALSKEKSGILGNVNIQIYPEHVKNVLAKLTNNEFTKPIRYGERYIIIKRLKNAL